MLRLLGDCKEGVGRAFRTGNDCSLEGGAGGDSSSEIFELSPNGPSGPKESSMASSRVACAPTFRGVRGCRPTGDLGVEDVDSDEGFVCLDCVSASANSLVGAPSDAFEIGTLSFGFCSFIGKVGI